MDYKVPPGTRDILPPEIYLWQEVEETARRIAQRAGYCEIRTPVFEATDLFVRGIGEASEVVQKQMYTFQTLGGESLTLRPEMTAPVMRAYLEHSMHKTGAFRKLYYLGPSFRYERAQKGRWRQFSQFGIEAVGSADPLLDVETIVVGWDILAECGVPDLKLLLNSIGCPECRPAYREALGRHIESRQDALCEDCRRRADSNVLRILDCKKDRCAQVVRDAPDVTEFLCSACAEHFRLVRQGIEQFIPEWSLEPRLVRGLDYYTHTVYEFVAGELGSQNAVGGGGRYDLLIEEIGGPKTPSVGFALGLDRIVMSVASTEKQKPPGQAPDVFVVTVEKELAGMAQKLVVGLRRHMVAAEMDYEGRSLKAQFRAANKSGARHVAVLGPDEAAKATVRLKTLSSGEEREVAQARLHEEILKGE